MPKIDQEIEEMAKSVEESVMTPKDQLIKTINELGLEGIKTKMTSLTKSEKEVLFDTLEEMKKSASPAMDANYAAEYVKGDVYKDTVIQEDKADDDADEKLVKPANAEMKNQGDNAPEGFEGQVIKAKEMDDSKKEESAKEKLVDAVDDVAEAEVKEHEDDMHKKDMKKSDIDIADDADETADEAVGKVKKMKDENHEKKMKKSVEINGKEFDLYEVKIQAEEILKSEGIELTNDLVKGKIKELLAEASQSKDKMDDMQKDKVRGDKSIPEDQNVGKDNKKNMSKSVEWADKNALLKSDRGGRNHSFSVNGYYDEALAKAEPKKEGEEDLKKSEPEVKDYDLNDLIEKDMTTTWKELDTANGLAKSLNETNGQLVKSFETNEIAQALGLSEEEAKKILGE